MINNHYDSNVHILINSFFLFHLYKIYIFKVNNLLLFIFMIHHQIIYQVLIFFLANLKAYLENLMHLKKITYYHQEFIHLNILFIINFI